MTSPRPGKRKADLVADDLLRRIVSGEIGVGSLLPREAELARRHGVNRSVVREAIKLLEVHGLVRPVRRRGTEVLDPRDAERRVVGAMLVPCPGRIDRRVLASVLEIRAELDAQMTMLAAERRSTDDARQIDRAVRDLRAALARPEEYARRVGEIGRLVARASKNPLFQMLAAWHASVTEELAPLFAVVRPASEAHVEGMALLARLIARRDTRAAGDLVRGFHAWSTPRLMKAAALSHDAPRARKERMARP
ncbi:MAG: GntR family transcriptional regulator [Acidobacteriota bacterium]